MPKKKKHTLIDKLSERFHILLVNEKTLAKKKLFSSSAISLASSSLFVFLLLLSSAFMVIYITPLKEYFRGYTSIELRENAVENSMKLDSLESLYLTQSNYIKSLQDLLSGNISFEDLDKNTATLETNQIELQLVKTNTEDSLLRVLVDEEDKYNAFELEGQRFTTVLFPPVKGGLSSRYDNENKHYGVDIVMPENSPVHSISEGIVVFAE